MSVKAMDIANAKVFLSMITCSPSVRNFALAPNGFEIQFLTQAFRQWQNAPARLQRGKIRCHLRVSPPARAGDRDNDFVAVSARLEG
jgi:hypothetical protein